MEEETRNALSWAEAFRIFYKYDTSAYFSVAVEHDGIYAGPKPEKVSDEDWERLGVLGWHPCDYGCFRRGV